MRHVLSALVLSLIAQISAGPAMALDSKIVTTAKNASAKPAPFTKIMVIVASPDADLRRRAEGGLARRIRNAVAATAAIPDVNLDDREAVKSAIRAAGADGVLLLRPLPTSESVNMEATEQYVVAYPSLWDYWDTNWLVVTRPGAVTIEKIVTVEIAIFSVASEQVMWAGRMTATNPTSLRVFLDDMVDKGSKELRKQKLI